MIREVSGDWFPGAWRKTLHALLRAGVALDCLQMPSYESESCVRKVEQTLAAAPPLVSVSDTRRLQEVLARVAAGQGFVVQGGDCAESLNDHGACSAVAIYNVIRWLSVGISSEVQGPIVSIGRVAGQYAKPRSQSVERRRDMSLPVYRGDLINGQNFTKESRQPDPWRMLQAYQHAARSLDTLSLLFHKTGCKTQEICTDITELADTLDHAGLYTAVTSSMRAHLERVRGQGDLLIRWVDPMMYTSHEALLLPYEQALTRFDEKTERWYCGSAHFLWVGNRTHDPSGPHVEFLRGISNPIGVKLGSTVDSDVVLRLCQVLNPQNIPGRLTLITRMGAAPLEKRLPNLVRDVAREGAAVIWSCDPMHANTKKLPSGHKTRYFQDIAREIRTFFSIHGAEGSYPGALHLELTGSYVTECVGGVCGFEESMLNQAYQTLCDPRLNPEQALELAFLVAEQFRYRAKSNKQNSSVAQEDCAL